MPTQGLLAIAFLEASALLILLVLYFLLYRDLTAHFFRLWLIGWTLFTGYGTAYIVYILHPNPIERLLLLECYSTAIAFFLAAVLEYTGHRRLVHSLWPLAAVNALWLAFTELHPAGQMGEVHWATAIFESAALLAAGWVLWRHSRGRSGNGAHLLAAALWLAGLHGMDQPYWPAQSAYLLRVAFHGFLEMAVGIALAVLVLETARAGTEDLNDKLRRLTLITTASTQTLDVDQVTSEVLNHLVESLNASHGLIHLLAGEGESARLVLHGAVGFSDSYVKNYPSFSANEPWAREILVQNTPFLSYLSYERETDAGVRRRMQAEKISAMILVRIPGKDAPLGVLAVGSSAHRRFQADEVAFVVNVANLLGLTVQNVRLLDQAATAQRHWAYTFDSISDPILVHDTECRILRANRRLGDHLGKQTKDMVGRPVGEVFRQSVKPWSKSWSCCPYCEGAAGSGDIADAMLGGYFLASTSDFHDAAGHRLGTVHVLKDLSDRRQAEEKYRNLIENVQEGVFISTAEGRFEDFNDAFMRMLGYESREELLNVDIVSTVYVNPADRERLKKLLREHGAVSDFEFQMRRKDGEVLTVLESSFVTRDVSGQVVAFQGFVLDISERKRAEQEIRRRNRELMVLNSIGQTLSQSLELSDLLARALRQVVELFGVDVGSIYLLEEETRMLRRAAAIGYRSEYSRSFPPTVLPIELIEHIRAVRATVLSGQSLPLPPVFRDLQQKEMLQSSHVVVLWSKDRMIGGLVVGCRTTREFAGAELNLLTSVGSQIGTSIEKMLLHEETREAYENLRRTQEQLLQSEKMAAVGQLISGVAHELNNPLTAILGYSQLLSSSDFVSTRGAEYVDKLYKQAQRTHRIVHNLLSFARQQRPERLPVRLNQVVEDTLALREYDLKVNNIRIHRDLAPELPLTAADAHQLQQVFLNILNNAVDAILERPERREIWVRSAMDNGRLLLEIADSGRGVQDVLRVFDPFYTTKPVGKGTGLGLSICYGIISEHGGEISVRNSPPNGATFSISLPVMPVSQRGDPSQAPEQAPSCGRVLLVDDEEAVLDLEQEILAGRCQSVTAARSGREAQRILEREPVDLVVTDLKMPGEITGRDLYEWIRRRHPDLGGRVIFTVSGATTEEIKELIEEYGCQYIQKPFEVQKFLSVVARALSQIDSSTVKH